MEGNQLSNLAQLKTPDDMKHFAFYAMTAATLLFSACAKDGPEGPAGPAGAPGNANVKVTTFSAAPGDWSSISGGWAINRGVPNVTQDIVNSGAVIVYLKVGTAYVALPLSSGSLTWGYGYGVGSVQIEAITSGTITQVTEWKVIAIAGSGMKPLDGVDLNNYQAVCERLGLVE